MLAGVEWLTPNPGNQQLEFRMLQQVSAHNLCNASVGAEEHLIVITAHCLIRVLRANALEKLSSS